MNNRVAWLAVSSTLVATGLLCLAYASYYHFYVAREPVPLPKPLYLYRSNSGVLWFQLTSTERCINGEVVDVSSHVNSEITVEGHHFICKGNIARWP